MEIGERIESDRKEKDAIYLLTDRREIGALWHHVNGIQEYLKRLYGQNFERLPEIVGDRGHRDRLENPELVAVLDRVLQERRYEDLLLAFLLFLSFLKDVQDEVGSRVAHPEAYADWLLALQERGRCFREGTGDPVEDFVTISCVQYAVNTPIFLSTSSHREQASIEGHRE